MLLPVELQDEIPHLHSGALRIEVDDLEPSMDPGGDDLFVTGGTKLAGFDMSDLEAAARDTHRGGVMVAPP